MTAHFMSLRQCSKSDPIPQNDICRFVIISKNELMYVFSVMIRFVQVAATANYGARQYIINVICCLCVAKSIISYDDMVLAINFKLNII